MRYCGCSGCTNPQTFSTSPFAPADFKASSTMCTRWFWDLSSHGWTCTRRSTFLTHSLNFNLQNIEVLLEPSILRHWIIKFQDLTYHLSLNILKNLEFGHFRISAVESQIWITVLVFPACCSVQTAVCSTRPCVVKKVFLFQKELNFSSENVFSNFRLADFNRYLNIYQ